MSDEDIMLSPLRPRKKSCEDIEALSHKCYSRLCEKANHKLQSIQNGNKGQKEKIEDEDPEILKGKNFVKFARRTDKPSTTTIIRTISALVEGENSRFFEDGERLDALNDILLSLDINDFAVRVAIGSLAPSLAVIASKLMAIAQPERLKAARVLDHISRSFYAASN